MRQNVILNNWSSFQVLSFEKGYSVPLTQKTDRFLPIAQTQGDESRRSEAEFARRCLAGQTWHNRES